MRPLDQALLAFAALALTALIIWFIPAAAAALLALNGAVMLAVAAGQWRWRHGRRPETRPRPADNASPRPEDRWPFVSIHMASCSEPPALVTAALDALARLDYPADRMEVIVLDNNTRDPGVWRPVEAHCNGLGDRFRFVHVDELAGFKAGALRECAKLASPEAEFIATVDADYRVDARLLKAAIPEFDDPAVSHVQFPQAYFNVEPGAEPLADEFEHFFDVFMTGADRAHAPLLTGTLSVIRRDALERVEGWSSETITEDAELGVRLIAHGFRGVYLHQNAGRGVMPLELSGLRKQRFRWAAGNAQTIALMLGRGLFQRIGWRRTGVALLQLSAWFNFLALPGAVLMAAPFLPDAGGMSHFLAAAASLSILAWLTFKASFFRAAAQERTNRWLTVFSVHLALSVDGALAPLAAPLRRRLPFVRTRKNSETPDRRASFPHVALTALCTASAIACLYNDWLVAAVGALALGASFSSIFWLDHRLSLLRRDRAARTNTVLPPASTAVVPLKANP